MLGGNDFLSKNSTFDDILDDKVNAKKEINQVCERDSKDMKKIKIRNKFDKVLNIVVYIIMLMLLLVFILNYDIILN